MKFSKIAVTLLINCMSNIQERRKMTTQFKRVMKIGTAAALATLVLVLIIMPCATALAEQLDINNVFDRVFLENIEELARGEYSGQLEIEAEKEALYDMHLDELGYVYNFKVNGEEGYAIAVGESGEISLTEVFFKTANPYKDIPQDALAIYHAISVFTYNIDGRFYWLTGTELNEKELEDLEVFSFKATYSNFTNTNESVSYISKNDDVYVMTDGIPTCVALGDMKGGCTAVTGANIIQFMDKRNVNLIPNYEPGEIYDGFYMFKRPGTETSNLIRQLLVDIGVDSNGGATVAQFKSGMTKYCERMGYKLHFDKSIASGGKFNYEYAKVQLMSHRPLALFLSKYSYASIWSFENRDSISTTWSDGNHAMAAFGYREINYTLTSGTRIDQYLYVATGDIINDSGYYNINKNTTIDDCYGLFVTDLK